MALINKTFIFLLAILYVNCAISPKRREQVCQAGAIDLVLVVDESGSIGSENFKVELDAAVDLTQTLSVGTAPEKSRVGMVLFDDAARVVFGLDAYTTNAAVAIAIRGVSYSSGGTDIAKGMDVAIRQVFINRSQRPRIMVIITDGEDTTDVGAEQSLAKENGIIVYAIGVGPTVDMAELTAATGDVNRVFLASNFANLSSTMDLICEDIISSVAPPPDDKHKGVGCDCETEDDYLNVWLDIIFVVDSSNDVSDQDFQGVKTLLQQIGYYYTIGSNPGPNPEKFSRVAVINTGETAVRFANFSTYKDGLDLAAAVGGLQPINGAYRPELGIKHAQDMIDEEKTNGVRDNVRTVVVLFSSVALDCSMAAPKVDKKGIVIRANDEFCRIVATMASEKTVLMTVAFKLPEDEEFPFINLGDSCDRFNNSENMVTDIMRALCLANCYCLSPYTQFVVPNTCLKYGECVFVQNIALSYDGASRTCSKENSTLAQLWSPEKDAFVNDLHLSAGFFPFWIGLTRSGGLFKYPDGSALTSQDHSNWCVSKNQPGTNGDCVFQNQCSAFNTSWFTDVCGKMTPTHYFSCQKSSCSSNRYCHF